MKQLTAGAGGATVNAVSTGAVVTAAGDVLVPASGLKIPVPVSVAANVGKARIAAAALGCTNPIGAVVCAATAAQVGHELLNQDTGFGRYRKCPDGIYAFICRESNPLSAPVTHFTGSVLPGVYMPTGQAYCDAVLASSWGAARPAVTSLTHVVRWPANNDYCGYGAGNGNFADDALRVQRCAPSGTAPNTSKPLEQQCGSEASQLIPASPAEIGESLQQRMDADFQANRRLVEAMRRDQAAAEAGGRTQPDELKPVVASTPVTVTAPPVTSPESVISVGTKPLPDGSTDTTTTKQRTTVTPQVSGSTVGDVQIKYPSQTTVTQTTVNNVTNNTTTNTSVVNNPTPQEKAGDFPDDYAREETLQKVADALDTSAAPDMPDQKVVVDDAIQKGKDDIGTLHTETQAAQDADKGVWCSWVFDLPTATCSPFSGNVGGFEINWDLCPAIENIRSVLGWLMTIFSALSVYGNLFRRGE
jgi:hypothetical protein